MPNVRDATIKMRHLRGTTLQNAAYDGVEMHPGAPLIVRAGTLQGITRKNSDIVAAWSVDRLGRSLQHLLSFLVEGEASVLGDRGCQRRSRGRSARSWVRVVGFTQSRRPSA